MFNPRQALFLLGFLPLASPSIAQADIQYSYCSGKTIFTVSNEDGHSDIILFSTHEWDEIVDGTKYTSVNLLMNVPYPIYIEIADKVTNQCKGGIGFSCSLFDRKISVKKFSIVNHTNRLAAAFIQRVNPYTVKLIFLNKIDWNSLQKNK